MVTFTGEICNKCGRRNVITFEVAPAEAYKIVVLNRWRNICPSCFDAEAERAGIDYRFATLDGLSWSERPAPKNPYKRKR